MRHKNRAKEGIYMKNSSQKDEKVALTPRQTVIQIVKFVLFSAGAGIIQVLTFTLLNEGFKISSYNACYLPALVLSVLYNFTVNRKFTFKSAANVPIAMLKVAVYYCIFTPLSAWWGDALEAAGWNEYLVLALTMLVNLSTEFLYCRFFVYGKSINTNAAGKKEQENIEKKK